VDVATGEIFGEDMGEGVSRDGVPLEAAPNHSVSQRLAALKAKLQQKRSVSSSRDVMEDNDEHLVGNTESRRKTPERGGSRPEAALTAVPLPIPAPETGQMEGGGPGASHSGELERWQQEQIHRLRIEMEKESRKNEHLLELHEDAEANARKAEARAGELEEEVRKLKEARDALVEGERVAREEAARAREEAARAREEAARGREEAARADREDDVVDRRVSSDRKEEVSGPLPSSDREAKEMQSLKEQLEKLKMQMLATQTAFEEQIEAEVQERVSALAQGMSTNPSKGQHEEYEQLLADLEIALDKIQEAEKESVHWKSEAERMRDELRNMQIALDELRYESENGEKLRVQVRAAQAEVRAMEARVAEALASKEALELKADKAAQKAEEERRRAFAAREAEGVAKQELIAMQVAFGEISKKEKEREGRRGAVERDTVVEVLKEMSGMRHGRAMKHGVDRLGLTEAERRTVLGDNSGLASTFVAFLETSVVED